MRDAVVEALREKGCPDAVARRIADSLRIVDEGEWLALLDSPTVTHGCGIEVPVTPDQWSTAVHHLVENVAADNAEAVDRAARGEPGWTPMWPLPGRKPRPAAGK